MHEEDAFVDDSNRVKNSLLTYGAQLADKTDELERKTTDHTAYYGYLKDFLINSGCLCDDIMEASFNDAVLLAMIGTRVLLEDTINAHYLKSRGGVASRMAVAAEWFKLSNDPAAYKNKLDGKNVAKRAADANDNDIQQLHDGEYADFCNYTHSTAQRTILNIPAHRMLAAKKTAAVSIRAYVNTLACMAEIIGEPASEELVDEVRTYFDKYRDDVMEATLDIDRYGKAKAVIR